MSRTLSNMLPLGTIAPQFTLQDTVTGKELSLQKLKSHKATVVMFICNHCPFVLHVLDGILDFVNDFSVKGVSFVAISSNEIENYPQDGPEKMRELALQKHFSFPYLYDETQKVAKAYDAACTPDFYIFDPKMRLVYRGQMDDSRPGNDIPVTGRDLRNALQNLLEGKPVSVDQKPSLGCNIKWK